MKKSFLITGGAGYLGSMLTSKLVYLGHEVYVMDSLLFSKEPLFHLFSYPNFHFVHADVRSVKILKKLMSKVDYVLPLAALVGAPVCEKNKKTAIEVNLKNIEFIVRNIKKNQRIIYPTTNSGYGVGEKSKYCTEESPLRPVSLYGVTKNDAEKIILTHPNSICFRLATVFGYSHRMRTDLLVNNLVDLALKKKSIKLFEPHFRRNFVHIKDVIDAFIFSVDNFQKLKGEVYNLGLSNANISKLALVKKIKKHIKDLKIIVDLTRSDPDKRDYFVSNRKIEKKGFKAKVSLDDGIVELINILPSLKKIKNNY